MRFSPVLRLVWFAVLALWLAIGHAPARAAVAANDVIFQQRNAGNTGNNNRFIPAQNYALFAFDSSGVPTRTLAPTGLTSVGAATIYTTNIYAGLASPSPFDSMGYTASFGGTPYYRQASAGAAGYGTVFAHHNDNPSDEVGAFFAFARSYNPVGVSSNGAVVSGTTLGRFFWQGADGTGFSTAVAVFGVADGAVSTGVVPGKLVIKTANSSGTLTTALTIDSTQRATIAGGINTPGEIQSAGNRVNYNLSVYGAGTAYALTNTAAAIDFGTTDPTKVIDKAGTYLIFAQVHLTYNGATVVAETATIKVRRTNNTAADLSAVVVIDLPIATTLTHSYGTVTIPPFVYTTSATDDSVTIFANVSAGLGAGTIDATAIGTSLVAVRLY